VQQGITGGDCYKPLGRTKYGFPYKIVFFVNYDGTDFLDYTSWVFFCGFSTKDINEHILGILCLPLPTFSWGSNHLVCTGNPR